MALIFKKGWNEARKDYVKTFGKYQAFLDTLTESLIVGAFRDARNHFSNHWVLEFIDIATNPGRVEQVSIIQGSHQPEDLDGGGFCLHFTGKDNSGYGFHFYIIQNLDGTPKIIEITYREGDEIIRDFRR